MKNIIKKLLGIKEIKGVDLQPLKTRTVLPPVELFEEKKILTNPMQRL